KAPDFPTGGLIYGHHAVREAVETGRGRIVMRAKPEIETTKAGREIIVVTEIPDWVNKADMIKRTAEVVNEKKREGISESRDESAKDVRIIYDVKRDANANVVLNNLFKHTSLQTSFSVNNIALVKGRPMMMTLKDMIEVFVE